MVHRRFVVIAAALLAMGAELRAQSDTRVRVDTTFAFARNGWADLSITSGDIVVTGWTRPEARVVARIDDGTIETLFTSNRVGLTARPRRTSRSRSSRIGDARYEVWVPVGTRVMISATSGDVRVRGTGAEVQVQTTNGAVEVLDANERVDVQTISGDIHLSRIHGRSKVFTTNGDLTMDEIVGELQVKTVSSDLVLRRVQSSEVRIGTTSGDITYGGVIDPKGTYDISTHSGEIRFEVPGGTGANLTVQTYSGDIHSDFRMTLQPGENIRKTRGRKMEYTIGDGGARVTLVTFSGDITIRRTGRTERNDQ